MKTIETERLILREWTLEDANDLFDYAKSDLVGPNAGWKPHKSLDESKKIVEMFINDDDVWAIVHKENKKVIGSLGIHDRIPDESFQDKTQKEIGYVLHPDYWGNGYVPEAVERVKVFCFNELNTDILWCGHHDYNLRSKRVIEKCGFTYKFTKNMILKRFDNKEVKTLFYSIEKK